MVTQEQIDGWKKDFGKIFKIRPAVDVEIIYRLVSRQDYIDIMAAAGAGMISDPELETVSRCILNDIDMSVLEDRGGIVTVVYEDIMKNSGFTLVESEEL